MKKILLLLAVGTTLLISCEKATDNNVDDETIQVTVKQIDAICADAIFEIMDTQYKQMGQQNFEYKGVVYNGVFGTNLMCTNLTPTTFGNDNGKYYKVTLSKTKFDNCNIAICLATLTKMPTVSFYVK
jgi:hypothetical protein